MIKVNYIVDGAPSRNTHCPCTIHWGCSDTPPIGHRAASLHPPPSPPIAVRGAICTPTIPPREQSQDPLRAWCSVPSSSSSHHITPTYLGLCCPPAAVLRPSCIVALTPLFDCPPLLIILGRRHGIEPPPWGRPKRVCCCPCWPPWPPPRRAAGPRRRLRRVPLGSGLGRCPGWRRRWCCHAGAAGAAGRAPRRGRPRDGG